jgi:hypothetical protein
MKVLNVNVIEARQPVSQSDNYVYSLGHSLSLYQIRYLIYSKLVNDLLSKPIMEPFSNSTREPFIK